MSCKKDKLLTDASAKIRFSSDSVLFDTVFTTIGSATRNIRIINTHKQKIKLSSVHLQQGQSSPFFLNVDGMPGKVFSDIEIPANDSIFVFIQVNVNPTNQNSPLIINDKLVVEVNGNEQTLALEAWGQDAYYHMPNHAIQYQNGFLPYSTVSSQTTAVTVNWPNDKPHVIYGYLVVDSAQKLTIDPGVKVYFHQNAGLWVYRYGCLQVNGALGQEVTFQGDRRESDYADLPGQWDRIWFNEGNVNNYINYAIIKNGYIGIQADIFGTIGADPCHLKVTNTIVKNCSKWGIYGQAFHIYGANNVFADCKEYCGVFTLGGRYTFIQNTFANYWNQQGGRGGQPCVHLDNYQTVNGVNQVLPMDSVFFANSIIDGSQGNELETDIKAGTGPTVPSYTFSYCLLKTTGSTPASIYTGCRVNQSANFLGQDNHDYRIGGSSAAISIGASTNYGYMSDIAGATRPNNPDAGAYQHQ